MKFILDLKEVGRADIARVGGKAASLGELMRAGLNVPVGFVITASAFDTFLRGAGLDQKIPDILKSAKAQDPQSIELASQQIRQLIESAAMPAEVANEIRQSFEQLGIERVAVRSSATSEDSAGAAWAGQLESYLNTTKENLISNVMRCWSSLFTPRAIFYHLTKDQQHQGVSVAVVVQKMVQSELAGVAFSIHPTTYDPNQIFIEAGTGLGEAVVSGNVVPSSYTVDKRSLKIIDQTTGSQAKTASLTNQQLSQLTELVIKIEEHFGFPCDVEWAWADSQFYIVQSRPITVLSSSKAIPISENISDYQRLFQVVAGGVKFLVSDFVIQYYRQLKGLLIYKDGAWTSYMPNQVAEWTLADGLELFGHTKKFQQYVKEFDDYVESSSKFFDQVLASGSLKREELVEFFRMASELFRYYTKTEHFYVDRAYKQSQENPNTELSRNLEQLGQVKNRTRAYLNQIFLGGDSYMDKLLIIISKQSGVSTGQLYLYKISELLDLLEGKTIADTVLKERDDAFVMRGNSLGVEYLAGAEAHNFISSFLPSDQSAHTVIRGIAANLGRAKGRAWVIPADYYMDFGKLGKMIDDMAQGDILIAETTSPELILACQKAGAIVTNQGGLLSHAAIISREMNIPCIVATNNATELIKTGDTVEVDGHSATVKIINNE